MSVLQTIRNRIGREQERIENLEASLPGLRERHDRAERQADQLEADHLLHEAATGTLDVPDVTDESLRRAKVAAHQRRHEVERTEREVRLARILTDRLEHLADTLETQDVDGQLADLDERVPKVAEHLVQAWEAFEAAASEADAIKREHARLRSLVPVKGIPVSLTRPVPRFPFLEDVRARKPHESMRHPASVLRKLGYDDLADRVQGAA